MKYRNSLIYLWFPAPVNVGCFLKANSTSKRLHGEQSQFSVKLEYLLKCSRFSYYISFVFSLLFSLFMFNLDYQIFGLQCFSHVGLAALVGLILIRLKIPQTLAGKKGLGSGPAENSSTFLLLAIGLLLSLFALVGEFGPMGFLPFGMIVTGFIIAQTSQKFLKKKVPPPNLSSGFSVKTLTFIAGGLVLVLTINGALGSALNVSFLQPPLSTQALATSANFGYAPVYIYTLLFAIAEEYLFRAVLLYLIYNWLPGSGIFLELSAVGGSSFAWVIFHFFVYGSAPLVLAFVFFTGIVFGVITIYSNNILAASTIHGINNLVAAGLTVIRMVP